MLGKLKKIFQKNSILKSFLLPHLFTLIVPIILITVIMFQINFNLYKTEIAERSKTGIESVKQMMDVETEGLMGLSGKLFSDVELLRAEAVEVNMIRSFQKLLNGYLGANNFISEIAVYYPKLDYVFSSVNSMSLERYLEVMYEAPGYSYEKFRNFVHASEDKIIQIPIRTRRQDDRDVYAYVVKETAVYSSQNRVALFLLDADYIGSILKNIEGDAYVFDENGYCIAKSIGNYGISEEHIGNAVSKNAEKLRHDGRVYSVSNVCSETLRWSYVFVSEYADTYRNLLYIQLVYTLVLLLIVIAGIFAILYSVKKVYRPIRTMAERLETPTEDYNELEAIDNNISYLFKTKNDLEKKVENAYTIAKEHMFYKLVNGEFKEEAEVRSKFAFYEVSFPFSYYYIALFEMEEFVAELADDVEKLIEEFAGEANCFAVTVFENQRLCVICPASAAVHTEEDYELLKKLQRFLEEMMMSRISVGVGNPVEDVSTVWKSYIEAKSAGDYKKIKGAGQILFFRDIATVYDKDKYVYPDMKKIPTYIKAGETKETFLLIDKMIASLSDAPLTVSQCVCFEMMLVILQAVSEKFGSDREDLYFSRFDITMLVNFESIQTLGQEMKKFLEDVFSESAVTGSEADHFIDRILEYIEANYNSPYFSVDNVARHFEVSTTYLGQYFKMKKAMTVSSYIARVQMDNAKRILLETDKTVKEIADEIGYTDVSNFIRRFKAQTGITPGLYRKAHKK